MNRHPVLTTAMVIVGVILLLPGICSIWALTSVLDFRSALNDGRWVILWMICFAISTGGIVLIVRALLGLGGDHP